jgi:hypothetical protein
VDWIDVVQQRGKVEGCLKHSNETSSATKCGEYIHVSEILASEEKLCSVELVG